jgi:hypothetical protein
VDKLRRWPYALIYEPWYDKSMSIELAQVVHAALELVQAEANHAPTGHQAIVDQHLHEAVEIWMASLSPGSDVGLEGPSQEAGGD